ncbi:cupin domain-containing protein [Trinickia diaoshuihuensis]|jgi:gentisate 1,2-dioxygenase|uniref:cupin domain-containing protein n=1 Tax=Trinickia diaoshuihuensis TaxID=2292265 RepID=UPI000E2878DB|nr:cupin domain-containing protein [Trinickia diaoshuihuensis]
MQTIEGDLLPFSEYLELTSKPPADPVVWKWQAIESMKENRSPNPQGTLALSGGEVDAHGTVAPGLSLVIQVLRPGDQTEPHRHSFWHLYIVRSGTGHIAFGEAGSPERIEEGDTVFVPAWCHHAIGNRDGEEPLVVYRLQNLPQNASSGNLMREIDGKPQLIYASTGSAIHR